MSEFKPLIPGTKEFDDAVKSVQDLQLSEDSTGLEIKFVELPLGDTGATLKHAIVQLDDNVSKIVILVSKASTKVMTDVSIKLKVMTEELNIKGTFAEAEVSPVIAKQFDYVLFNVPNLRVKDVRNYLVTQIAAIYK